MSAPALVAQYVPIPQLAAFLGRPVRFALLERRSKFDEDTKSLQVQHDDLVRYLQGLPDEDWVCDLRPVQDGGDVYRQVVSAWKGDGKHKLLDQIMADLSKYDVVLVHRLDRFGRQAHAVLTALNAMKQAGVRVFSVQQGLDSTDPAQNFSVGIYAVLAQQSSDLTSERIKENKARAKNLGGWRGGSITYGYRPATTLDASNRSVPVLDANGYKTLEIDPAQAAVIRDVVGKITTEGASMAAAVRNLNKAGVATSRGTRRLEGGGTEKIQWSVTTLKRILANPMLMGYDVVGSGRNRFRILRVAGEPNRPHPPILSEDTWHRLQPLITLDGPRRTATEALLAGVVYCRAKRNDGAVCGRHLYGPGTITANTGSYACRLSNVLPSDDPAHCTGNAISAAWLEKMVDMTVAALAANPAWQKTLTDAYHRARGAALSASRDVTAELAEATGLLAELRAEWRAAKSDALRNAITTEIDEVDARIARLEQAAPVIEPRHAAPVDFTVRWADATRQQRRALICDMIERIDIDPVVRRQAKFDPSRVTIQVRHVGVIRLDPGVQLADDRTCPECGEKFPRPAALGIHRRHRHGVVGQFSKRPADSRPTYRCPAAGCRMTTTVAGALKRHVAAQHDGLDALVCAYGCATVFGDDEARQAHVRKRHSDPAAPAKGPMPCMQCGKILNGARGLAVHLGRVHSARPAPTR